MKNGHFSASSVFALVFSLCQPSVAWSESLALILTNTVYDQNGPASGVANNRAFVEAFEDAGFRIIAARDLSAAGLRQTAVELQSAIAHSEVDRLAIVLSGRFVTGTHDSWLLGRDTGDLSAITVGASGLSVSAMAELAGLSRLQTIMVLMPASDSNLPVGFGLTPGIKAFAVPQGITVAQGPSLTMQRWVVSSLLTPGFSLSDAANAAPEGVDVSGFLSSRISFLNASDAPRQTLPTVGVPQALAELTFWNTTRDTGTEAAYLRYLQRYPDGRFAPDAQALIADLRNDPHQQAEAGEAALGLTRNARRDVQRDLSLLGFDPRGIDGVFGPGSRSAIRAHQRSLGLTETGYLNTEQLRSLRRDATARAEELEREAQDRRELVEAQDRAYWESIRRGRDEAGLHAYLERYPDGLFAELAQQRLNQIDEDRRQQAASEERSLWDRVRAQDTAEAYQQFLQAFPSGSFTEAARARLAQLEAEDGNRVEIEAARTEEGQVAGSQLVRILVEQRLSQIGVDPGTVDGTFDAETRRAIRRFQQAANLPVTGYVTQATMVRLLASGTLQRN